jgi:hypothetical protein
MPRNPDAVGHRVACPDNNSKIICLHAPPQRGPLFSARLGVRLERSRQHRAGTGCSLEKHLRIKIGPKSSFSLSPVYSALRTLAGVAGRSLPGQLRTLAVRKGRRGHHGGVLAIPTLTATPISAVRSRGICRPEYARARGLRIALQLHAHRSRSPSDHQ